MPMHEAVRIGSIDALRGLVDLPAQPVILLSASLPVLRVKEGEEDYERNRRQVEAARPELIRAAIVELCRWAFQRGYNLVFGGHPTISPLVVEAARRFSGSPRHPDQNGHESRSPRVFVFQSEYFPEKDRARATNDLVTWDVGQLVLTPKIEDRRSSLACMRDIMVHWPGMRGAVFIGGMEGINDEANRFKEAHARAPLPCFAVGSAGGEAKFLLKDNPDQFAGLGRPHDRELLKKLLATNESYALIMQHIFRELGDDGKDPR